MFEGICSYVQFHDAFYFIAGLNKYLSLYICLQIEHKDHKQLYFDYCL